MNLLEQALDQKSEIVALRRDLHQHPELGFKEVRTSGIVAQTLTDLGLEVMTGIAETGVIGLLEGKSKSPVLLLRFDMDALPIDEKTGASYASKTPGVMHACGHDAHTAIGVGAARLLAERRKELPGTIKFVFQPAEEGDGGAARMVADGVLENPKPNYVMGLHVWNEMRVGEYGLPPGPMMAGAELFNVRITGKGGHGASPHKSQDPVVAAAHIVTALQTITSRNLNPLDSAVLSIGEIKAGSAFNIIPEEAILTGTIRGFKTDVLNLVKDRFSTITTDIARAMGCEAEINLLQVTYPVDNDAELTELMAGVIRSIDTNAKINTTFQTMGSEDFSLMMRDIPGCFLMVGSANPDQGLDYGHHHPKFDIDEACLPNAVAIIAQGAIEILRNHLM